MSLDVAAGISAILGTSLTVVPVGLAVHGTLQSLRPKTKLKKWSIRVEQICSVIASKGDRLKPQELEEFLRALRRYKDARDSLCQRIEEGTCTWYGKGMEHANAFSFSARIVWSTGLFLSTEASTRMTRSYLPSTSTEAVSINGVISVNLEDDTEDDSDSDSNGIMIAPQQVPVIAVYDFKLWRASEMPEQPEELEQNPWASTASLLDKLRGVVPSRQKPQHQI